MQVSGNRDSPILVLSPRGRVMQELKGVHMFMRKMGLKVCDMAGNDVLLSDFIEDSLDFNDGSPKKISKEKDTTKSGMGNE